MNPVDVDAYRDALRVVYQGLDDDVARLAPVCRASGRCCRFEEYGHTLFVSSPEFERLLADAPPPTRPLDDGVTCPWQDGRGRCTAREARPLGCRVYFCDPDYEPRAAGLAEAAIGRLKRIVDALGLPWEYAPLHRHLRDAVAAGRFPPPGAPPGTGPALPA